MNKHLILLLFSASLIFITACNGQTQVNWKNSYNDVSEIKWETQGNVEVTWSGTLASGATNEAKPVTNLSGNGACLDGGSPKQIVLSGGSVSKTLTAGSSETLVIQSTQ